MEYDDPEEDEEEDEEGRPGYDRRSPQARKLPAAARPGGGRYRECLKNHAVGIGGHAVDGCGEFMPAGEEGTLDALKCAACSCHRNFHRRELPAGDAVGFVREHAAHLGFPYYHAPVGAYGLLQHVSHSRHPPPLALPSTSSDTYDLEGSPGELHMMGASGAAWAAAPSGKKRFRTKFTQEQKDRMLEFSERMGWRIQKHDEAAVQLFCEEVGIRRQVLKVWMHNNKNTLGRPPPPPPPPPSLLDPIPDLDSRERLPPP